MQSKQEEGISELGCLVCVDSLYLQMFTVSLNVWPSNSDCLVLEFWSVNSYLSSKLQIKTLIPSHQRWKDDQDTCMQSTLYGIDGSSGN